MSKSASKTSKATSSVKTKSKTKNTSVKTGAIKVKAAPKTDSPTKTVTKTTTKTTSTRPTTRSTPVTTTANQKSSHSNSGSGWTAFMVIVIVLAVVAIGAFLYMEAMKNSAPSGVAVIKTEREIVPVGNLSELSSVTYSGVLPCADCPGIDETLTLNTDAVVPDHGTFVLTDVYQDRDVAPLVTTGDWLMMFGTDADPNAEVYLMIPEDGSRVMFYEKVNDNTVRQLDAEGNEIESNLNFDLTKVN